MGGRHSCSRLHEAPTSNIQNLDVTMLPVTFQMISNFRNKINQDQFQNTLKQTKFPEDIITSLSKFLLGNKLVLSDIKFQVKPNGLFTNVYVCGFKRINQNNIQLFLENYQGTAPYSALKYQFTICWDSGCSLSPGTRTVNRPLNFTETEQLKSNLTIKSKEKGKQVQNKMRLALKI